MASSAEWRGLVCGGVSVRWSVAEGDLALGDLKYSSVGAFFFLSVLLRESTTLVTWESE
jgi:hypothetical protein